MIYNKDSIFFTADTHFFHRNIIKYESGFHSFSSIEEHDDAIIENWNNCVPADATVFHLGDFAFFRNNTADLNRVSNLISQLNGAIVLILGNHDSLIPSLKPTVKDKFKEICHYKRIQVDDPDLQSTSDFNKYQDIIMFHYPMISWEKAMHGSWHLHGHTHEICYNNGKLLNVGVVNHNYKILSYTDIKNKLMAVSSGINPVFTSY